MDKLIAGLGEVLWDCLPEGKKLGGAPANFAYHASMFGYQAYAVSALGNDALGDRTVEELDKKHLRHIMPRIDFPTGTVQVELDEEGVPTYGCRWARPLCGFVSSAAGRGISRVLLGHALRPVWRNSSCSGRR